MDEVLAKVKVYQLMHQQRVAKMLENKIQGNLITREAMRPDDIHVFDRYCNGELTTELDDAKRARVWHS